MADGNVFEMQVEIRVGVAADGVVLVDDLSQVSIDERVKRVDMMAVQAAGFQVLLDQELLVAEHFDHFAARIVRERRSNTTRSFQSLERTREPQKRGGSIAPRFKKINTPCRPYGDNGDNTSCRQYGCSSGQMALSLFFHGSSDVLWQGGRRRRNDAKTTIEPAKRKMCFQKTPICTQKPVF